MVFRIAVVTPYYKETEEVLRQCLESVRQQTYPCDHFLVADGHPVDFLEPSSRIKHVILPKANADNGNTPRGIGSLLAAMDGYDAVAYLDADNWFLPQHLEKMVKAHEDTGAFLVSCRRAFHTLDGDEMPISEWDEDRHQHVDTSCWLVFRPAFSIFNAWFMPKVLSPMCDRIFFARALHEKYRIIAIKSRSVAFRTQYNVHYRMANMAPPKDGKKGNVLLESLAYLSDPAKADEIDTALGFDYRNYFNVNRGAA